MSAPTIPMMHRRDGTIFDPTPLHLAAMAERAAEREAQRAAEPLAEPIEHYTPGTEEEEAERLAGVQAQRAAEHAREAEARSPFDTTNLAGITARPVKWRWHLWIPRGAVTMFDGNPGEAKSTIIVDLAARVTTGREWPDGASPGDPGRVLYITGEDDVDDTILPRLLVAGGNPHLVEHLSAFAMPTDEMRLRRTIERMADLRLVLIDPLYAHVDAKVKTISDVEMRQHVMTPLQRVARETGQPILVTRHNSKDTSASPLNRGAGSLGGIAGSARQVLACRSDPDDDNGRLFGVVKSSWGPGQLTLRYHVAAATLDLPGWTEQNTVSRIVWDGVSKVTIDEVTQEGDHETARNAEGYLRELLKGKVSVSSAEVAARMKAKGFGVEATRSARRRIGARLTKSSFNGGWVVYLPAPGTKVPE